MRRPRLLLFASALAFAATAWLGCGDETQPATPSDFEDAGGGGDVVELADGASVETCNFQDETTGVCSEGQYDAESETCDPPSAYEAEEDSCDGLDNDCDGEVDEGCACDFTGESAGVCSEGVPTEDGGCDPPDTYEAEEDSCDGLDNDCDGEVDEGCGCDFMGESAGVCSNGVPTEDGGCDPPDTYEADEDTCDNLDNDCDGETDEGCQNCNYNGTSEGICSEGILQNGDCQAPEDYESDETTCGDEIDNDCDGTVDEFCPCDYQGKSTGVCGEAQKGADGQCQEPANYEEEEQTCDELDNDCDGSVDEGSTQDRIYYLDDDNDGFGDPENTTTECSSTPPEGYVANDDDCNDDDDRVNPDQESYFADPHSGGSYDYNCDETEETESEQREQCNFINANAGCMTSEGWRQGEPIPECGETGDWLTDCTKGTGATCEAEYDENRTQKCR